MQPLPEQSRPLGARVQERYESTALLSAAVVVHDALGWVLVAAERLEDGTILGTYER